MGWPLVCIICILFANLSVRLSALIIAQDWFLLFMVVNVDFKCRHFSQIFVLIGGIVPTDKIANRVIFHFRNVFLIVRSVVVGGTQYYDCGDRMLHRVKGRLRLG